MERASSELFLAWFVVAALNMVVDGLPKCHVFREVLQSRVLGVALKCASVIPLIVCEGDG